MRPSLYYYCYFFFFHRCSTRTAEPVVFISRDVFSWPAPSPPLPFPPDPHATVDHNNKHAAPPCVRDPAGHHVDSSDPFAAGTAERSASDVRRVVGVLGSMIKIKYNDYERRCGGARAVFRWVGHVRVRII